MNCTRLVIYCALILCYYFSHLPVAAWKVSLLGKHMKQAIYIIIIL